MGNWQLIGGVAATRRRTATVVIVAIVAVLPLLVVGCDSQLTPSLEVADSPVVVAAGKRGLRRER
jgi:hypothetical protein